MVLKKVFKPQKMFIYSAGIYIYKHIHFDYYLAKRQTVKQSCMLQQHCKTVLSNFSINFKEFQQEFFKNSGKTCIWCSFQKIRKFFFRNPASRKYWQKSSKVLESARNTVGISKNSETYTRLSLKKCSILMND